MCDEQVIALTISLRKYNCQIIWESVSRPLESKTNAWISKSFISITPYQSWQSKRLHAVCEKLKNVSYWQIIFFSLFKYLNWFFLLVVHFYVTIHVSYFSWNVLDMKCSFKYGLFCCYADLSCVLPQSDS